MFRLELLKGNPTAPAITEH